MDVNKISCCDLFGVYVILHGVIAVLGVFYAWHENYYMHHPIIGIDHPVGFVFMTLFIIVFAAEFPISVLLYCYSFQSRRGLSIAVYDTLFCVIHVFGVWPLVK